jgi:hypothetical protein
VGAAAALIKLLSHPQAIIAEPKIDLVKRAKKDR